MNRFAGMTVKERRVKEIREREGGGGAHKNRCFILFYSPFSLSLSFYVLLVLKRYLRALQYNRTFVQLCNERAS